MTSSNEPADSAVDGQLIARLEQLCDEGSELWHRFDNEVRQHSWHPFVPADYGPVLKSLIEQRTPGARFLEWGSASGVITIMADLLGFEAYGIELDASLVAVARDLAKRYDSKAHFVAGSFLPLGYRWKPSTGDMRNGTIGEGTSGYLELNAPMDTFDVVYGFPWPGEDPMMLDLMQRYGDPDARLILNSGTESVRVFRRGRQIG